MTCDTPKATWPLGPGAGAVAAGLDVQTTAAVARGESFVTCQHFSVQRER